MDKKWYKNAAMQKKLIESRNSPLEECLPENEVNWNDETLEAFAETERILADPNAKYYTLEEALKKLKE